MNDNQNRGWDAPRQTEVEHYFQAVVDSIIGYAILMLDPEGHVTSWNMGAQRLKGYSSHEIIGEHFSCFYSEEDRAAGQPALGLRTATATGRCEDEGWRVRKDGSRFWASVVLTAVRDERAQLRGFVKVTRDDTERRQSSENLRAANADLGRRVSLRTAELQATEAQLTQFKAALDEHAIVAITDARGKITYVNDRFCAISKCTREELLGQEHGIVNSGHHPQAFVEDLWQAIRRGDVWRGEIKDQAKDGTVYWVNTTIVPFVDERGVPVQYVAIRNDITRRKQAEERVAQLNVDLEVRAAHLAQANKELETFSYSISHDLRAPLRHVQGYVNMLQRATAGQLSEQAERYLQTIAAASVEMGNLIDALLGFSRMTRTEVHESQIDLEAMVRAIVRRYEIEAAGRRIDWLIAPLPRVVGDEVLLKQVMANLIDNAVKYSRRRDPARIEVGQAGAEDGRPILFVRDNGTGFDMQYAHKLFGVFQRLHRAEEFEGTGIGLATVQRVVARLGGRVWAEGAVDQGATFYLTLRRSPDHVDGTREGEGDQEGDREGDHDECAAPDSARRG
ncbi:MAG: PAS domain S-box protein [Vicinamibacterales bacterium]